MCVSSLCLGDLLAQCRQRVAAVCLASDMLPPVCCLLVLITRSAHPTCCFSACPGAVFRAWQPINPSIDAVGTLVPFRVPALAAVDRVRGRPPAVRPPPCDGSPLNRWAATSPPRHKGVNLPGGAAVLPSLNERNIARFSTVALHSVGVDFIAPSLRSCLSSFYGRSADRHPLALREPQSQERLCLRQPPGSIAKIEIGRRR